jgi:hypothetical protein
MFNYGKWIRFVDASGKIINKSIKDIQLVFNEKTLIWRQFISHPKEGVFLPQRG